MEIKRFSFLAGSIALVLVLISALILSSCSSSTTTAPATSKAPSAPTSTAPATSAAPAPQTSAPAPQPSAPATSKPAANVITLKYAPASNPPSPQLGQPLTVTQEVKLLQDRTNGQVKIDIYWSQTLAPVNDLANAVNSGLADIALIRPYGEPGKLPLSAIGEMPGLSSDLWSLLKAYYDLLNQPPLSNEMAKYNMKPLCSLLTQEVQLISRMPIRTLADLNGKKAAANGIAADELKSFGAIPVAMSPVEQSDGLMKGTIDCIAAPIDAINNFKFYESGKYITFMNLGPRIQPVVMNVNSFNKLPADIQKVFTDSASDLVNISYTSIIKDSNDVILKTLADSKVELIKLNDTDTAAMLKIQAAYGDKWAAGQQDPATAAKLLADYKSLVAKYQQTSPYYKK